MKDLVVLTACKDGEFAMRGLLVRHVALGIRRLSVDYFRHPGKDPGCLNTPEALLRSQAGRYQHALVLFDREGSGAAPDVSVESLESRVVDQLTGAGWGDRARCVVIEPELEAWVWSASPHVDEVLGWTGKAQSLRHWLLSSGWIVPGNSKPVRPKEAMEEAMREVGRQRSSSRFEESAKLVTLRNCTDPSFARLLTVLRAWFSPA
ncbi:hypothetical protein HZA57_07685 [Candidatus Poribacteria bacterium]|nr:hypothetical protein [Candidatus Poribacteria bacterium]